MKMLWKTSLAILGACCCLPATADNFANLKDSIPATWNYSSDHIVTLPSDDKWWQKFEDPVLSSLIERGEQNSYDLAATLHRIEAARQNWDLARSAYFPSVGATAGWSGGRQSGMTGSTAMPASNFGYFSLGLNFSWEIDLFGRVKEKSRAAQASYDATKAQYSAAMISLAGNIATAYFNYRLAQCQIEVTQGQIASQERIAKITEARHEAGLASKLDVAQALTVLYSTQAALPSLLNMRNSALNNLALLVGCYPNDISQQLADVRDLPSAFHTVALGVPADLLRRRPDILQAEYQLAGYAAQAGIAKKDFLPTLSLTGSLSTSAHKPGDLFNKESIGYSIAPQLSWTIFEGMARNRRVAMAKEQLMAGIDSYNLAVMNAVIETENALIAYDTSLHQISLYRKVVNESKESFELAVDRYKKGLSAFSDVMNAQLNLLSYENQLLQTRASALTTLVKVYTAVAGSI